MRAPVGPPRFDPEELWGLTQQSSPSPFRERVGRGFKGTNLYIIEYFYRNTRGSVRMYGSHGMDAAAPKAVSGTA